jgi:hypothetical protein
MKTPLFSLRLRSPALRELVREVSARERISQNDLIEQAVAHEVLLRGATLVADLESATERLTAMTDAEYARVVERSLADFAEGEGLGEPLQAHAFEPSDETPIHAEWDNDSLGVMAAFESAQIHPAQAHSDPSESAEA